MKGVFIWPNQRTWSLREKGGGAAREEKCPAWPLWDEEMPLIRFNETLRAHLCGNDETLWERRWGGKEGGVGEIEVKMEPRLWTGGLMKEEAGRGSLEPHHCVSKTDKQPRGQSSLSTYHIWTGWAISSARLGLKCVSVCVSWDVQQFVKPPQMKN